MGFRGGSVERASDRQYGHTLSARQGKVNSLPCFDDHASYFPFEFVSRISLTRFFLPTLNRMSRTSGGAVFAPPRDFLAALRPGKFFGFTYRSRAMRA